MQNLSPGSDPEPAASPDAPSQAVREGVARALGRMSDWPVDHAAGAVLAADGSVLGRYGDQDRVFALASVTKILASYAVLIAVEEGAFELDSPVSEPEGATVRHLLAHASGLDFSERRVRARPGERRIYSNAGFEVLGEELERATGMAFAEYLREAVLDPLGMTATDLSGSPAHAAASSVNDLLRFAAELQRPQLLHASTLTEAVSVQFPGLDGVLPGFGRQRPCDWGLGFSLRGSKDPHWTAPSNSPQTYGHFGQSGTFLWVDPQAGLAAIALTDRAFGDWAAQTWPPFSQAILDAA